jgi:putative ABC transport system permease protein
MPADFRLALRALRRAPGFLAAAACCLGLALGANAAVLALVDALLLRPLPFADAGRLVHVRLAQSAGGGERPLAVPYALDLRERSRTLSALAAYTGRPVALSTPAGSELVTATAVTGGFFDVLGVRPVAGRAFRPDESAPGAPRVAVLAEPFWRARFGGDPAVVGRTLAVDGQPTVVVGVMPARAGIYGGAERLWVPLPEDRDPARRGDAEVQVVARLAVGATSASAERELAGIGAALGAAYPATDGGWVPRLQPLRAALVGAEVRVLVWAMLGAVGFVLLIAAANVANLTLARAARRAREFAVRATLGAGRARVVRLVVAEAVCVAAAGLAVGAALGGLALAALRDAIGAEGLPAWAAPALDARVLAAMALVALVAGVGTGLGPALRATGGLGGRASLAPALRAGARGASAGGRRLRGALVAGELALSLALLVGAGLLVESVRRLVRVDPGFAAAGLVRAQVVLPGARYESAAARLAFVRDARARLAALPGTATAAATDVVPLAGRGAEGMVLAEGRDVPAGREPSAARTAADADYFAALGAPLVAGRAFTSAEAADSAAAVVIVNATLARRTWPGVPALGRRLALARGADGAPARWLTVVGVARDVRGRLDRAPDNQVYVPLAAQLGRDVTFLVRLRDTRAGAEAGALPGARAALGALDAAAPIAALEPMATTVRAATADNRLVGAVFGAFAGAALLLAVVGVYGVVAYQVAQRARELGVRLALGARPADVRALVLGDGARLAAAGLGLGLVLTLAVTRVLGAVLYGVSATDPGVLGLAAAALATATLAASWLPARRAAGADPAAALRAE